MTTRRRRILKRIGASILAIVAVCLVITIVRTFPLAEAPPHARVAPSFDAVPKSLRVCWLELLRGDAPGFAGTAGVTHSSAWNITVSGLLVRHPKGDVMIDAGNSSHFDEEIADYPFWPRFWLKQLPGSNRRVELAPDALRRVGANPEKVSVILSHGHVDHAGGIIDLPKTPLFLAQEEIDFMRSHVNDKSTDVIPAHARAIEGRAIAIKFDNGPYETFDESADLFGDGSIVMVKLGGHTPGSIGTFVNISKTKRFLHIGDSVNLIEQVNRRLGKSFVMYSTDVDVDGANRVVAKLAQLQAMDPELYMLPAHDRDAWHAAFDGEPHCIEPEPHAIDFKR